MGAEGEVQLQGEWRWWKGSEPKVTALSPQLWHFVPSCTVLFWIGWVPFGLFALLRFVSSHVSEFTTTTAPCMASELLPQHTAEVAWRRLFPKPSSFPKLNNSPEQSCLNRWINLTHWMSFISFPVAVPYVSLRLLCSPTFKTCSKDRFAAFFLCRWDTSMPYFMGCNDLIFTAFLWDNFSKLKHRARSEIFTASRAHFGKGILPPCI